MKKVNLDNGKTFVVADKFDFESGCEFCSNRIVAGDVKYFICSVNKMPTPDKGIPSWCPKQ